MGEWVLDIALLGGWLARWSYRSGLHGRFAVTQYEISLEQGRLPRPLTVAFASDFHAGPSTHPGIFSELFEQIAEQKPDLLLLGGDFVSCHAEYIAALTEGLFQCQPPLGKFAVFGNHDLWTDDAYLQRELKAAGVTVLVNQSTALPAPFDTVYVCGMDDPWTGSPDATETFSNAASSDVLRLLLMHAPDGLLLLGKEKFDVAFAGHTHGGQIALKNGTPILVPHGPLCRKFSYGRHEVPGSGSLLVSCGVGCSTLPVRINADPELLICRLS